MKKSYTTLNEEVTRIKTIMGIISEDKEILKEIGGGGSQPYKWEIIKRDELDDIMGLYIYEFSTDSNVEYEVTITRPTKEMTQVLRQSQKDKGEPVIEREGAYNRIEIQFGVTAIDGKKVGDGKEIVCDENGCSGVGVDSDIIINRGELYRVMSTVVKIVKSFISTHPDINELFIVPAKENIKDIRRLNLYIHYAQTQWPDADVKVDNHPELGGEIISVSFTSEIDDFKERLKKIKLTDPEDSTNEEYCGKRPFYNCYQKAIDEWWNDDEAKNWIELFKKDGFDTALSTILKNSWDSLENQAELVADLTICYTKCESKLVQDAISKIGDLSVGDITGVNIAKNAISKIKNWWN